MPFTFASVKKAFDRFPFWLKNRYAVSALMLVAWIGFFDTFDFFTVWKNQRILGRMEDEKEWYQEQIDLTREELTELTSDKRSLEKFARERYLMKRENEDIFVLVPEED